MKTSAIFTLCFFLSLAGFTEDVPILVSAQWVKDHQSDPRVILVHVDLLKLDYNAEHIPGANFLWPIQFAPSAPMGTMNEPDLKDAKKALENLGISNDSHVVLYFTLNQVSPVARIFLTIENLGMKGKVSLLDGGMDNRSTSALFYGCC